MPQNNYEKYKLLLSSRLSPQRYYHSLCVADEAERLALKYGGDSETCYFAGLLHDITKNASEEEHLKIFSTFGIILNNVEQNAKKLWHAMSGAAYIKNVLGVDNDEICDAVRYHTTAKKDMSLTAKILYIADFTSVDRDYDDVEVMRNLAEFSLDGAFIYALQYSITDLVKQKKAIHFDTLEAYNQVCNGGK